MVDWKPYLQSICATYDQLWEVYTLTDVVGKKHDSQVRKSLLLDLQAIAIKPEAIKPEAVKPEAVKPEAVKPEKELLSEASEKREILNVLEGLRKYASEHVLLIGRPGSGKSTALMRLLLEQVEQAQKFGDKADKGNETVGGKTQIPVLVESRGGIILRPSLLDPDVPISVHPAPDVLGFSLAHVDVIVTAFMYC
ncbi:MAG: hypothetical protein KME46_16175 [Brasilonema angustatum HA4187-MV1]|nr:hypothetical protein [Brasilonema angustatum HA4187-MV1]